MSRERVLEYARRDYQLVRDLIPTVTAEAFCHSYLDVAARRHATVVLLEDMLDERRWAAESAETCA